MAGMAEVQPGLIEQIIQLLQTSGLSPEDRIDVLLKTIGGTRGTAGIGAKGEVTEAQKLFDTKLKMESGLRETQGIELKRAEKARIIQAQVKAGLEIKPTSQRIAYLDVMDPDAKTILEKTLTGRAKEQLERQKVHPDIITIKMEDIKNTGFVLDKRSAREAVTQSRTIARLAPDVTTLKGKVGDLPGHVIAGTEKSFIDSLRATVKGGRWKKAGLAGGALLLLPLIAKSLFGKKDERTEVNPVLQMQLAAQAQKASQGESMTDARTLMNIGRLLNIIKTLQGMTAQQAPPPSSTAGLI